MRASGLLLHPTSLFGPEGIGTLGAEARSFIRFLSDTGTTWWQTLPLSPVGPDASPYMARSAMAMEPLLIDARSLVAKDWLHPSALAPLADLPHRRVDFTELIGRKALLLEQSYSRFTERAAAADRADFEHWRHTQAAWLDDYALFAALRRAHGDQSWTDWPAPLRDREPAALAVAGATHREAIDRAAFEQWVVHRQWSSLREFAHERGVRVLGDAPIFVAHDSADVWSNRELFQLDAAGRPTAVAGVPPDYFSKTGQLWGNPLYRWDVLAQDGYQWWIDRVRQNLATVDAIRIDHFRGFAQYWAIDADAPTAIDGHWVDGPGRALFDALHAALGDDASALPFVAEDLGIITPDVEALRDDLELPGMAILQFAFGGEADNAYLPHNFPTSRRVVYTGTHDNDTTAGWYGALDERSRHHVRVYLRCGDADAVDGMVRLAWSSTAQWAIAPVQDILELGSEARMNTPGIAAGNWSWRLRAGQLQRHHGQRLAEYNARYNRMARSPASTAAGDSPAAMPRPAP